MRVTITHHILNGVGLVVYHTGGVIRRPQRHSGASSCSSNVSLYHQFAEWEGQTQIMFKRSLKIKHRGYTEMQPTARDTDSKC